MVVILWSRTHPVFAFWHCVAPRYILYNGVRARVPAARDRERTVAAGLRDRDLTIFHASASDPGRSHLRLEEEAPSAQIGRRQDLEMVTRQTP